jgi:hypothetical protein
VGKKTAVQPMRHRRDAEMEYWLDQYKRAHPEEDGLEIAPGQIAEWIEQHASFKPKFSLVDLLRRRVARHLRNSYIIAPNGMEVHEHVSVAREVMTPDGKKRVFRYLPLFDAMDDDVWMNLQRRRGGSVADLTQMERDRVTYNLYNTRKGNVPELDYDFRTDVLEKTLPTKYPDAPKKRDDKDDEEDES